MARAFMRMQVSSRSFQAVRQATELFKVTPTDLGGQVLVRLGQVHRRQQEQIFQTEGAVGESGKWPRLSPEYARRKRRALRREQKLQRTMRLLLAGSIKTGPSKGAPISMKILVWSGDMRARFTEFGRPEHVERYVPTSPTTGVFQFGAYSDLAAIHKEGYSEFRRSKARSTKARGHKGKGIFIAKSYSVVLPARDMVTKTVEQNAQLYAVVIRWYRNDKVPQALRAIRAARRAARGAA
jgi:hypothetical protein